MAYLAMAYSPPKKKKKRMQKAVTEGNLKRKQKFSGSKITYKVFQQSEITYAQVTRGNKMNFSVASMLCLVEDQRIGATYESDHMMVFMLK